MGNISFGRRTKGRKQGPRSWPGDTLGCQGYALAGRHPCHQCYTPVANTCSMAREHLFWSILSIFFLLSFLPFFFYLLSSSCCNRVFDPYPSHLSCLKCFLLRITAFLLICVCVCVYIYISSYLDFAYAICLFASICWESLPLLSFKALARIIIFGRFSSRPRF